MTRRPKTEPMTVAATGNEITRTDCRRCRTEIFGIDGRYACGLCGWVNHWAEGDSDLPSEEDDKHWDR